MSNPFQRLPYHAVTLGLCVTLTSTACAGDTTAEPACTVPVPEATSNYAFVEDDTNWDLGDGNLKVGAVTISRLPIFNELDPKENNAVFRFANRFHALTRDETLRQQLLFEEGDLLVPRLLKESGRLLRNQRYLYDAAVRPVRRCGDAVDVEVVTRDIWSFIPELSFNRAGGKNTFSFGLRERNLFGYGKQLGIQYKQDDERTSDEIVYRDPNLFGSRVTTKLQWTDSDDGYEQLVDVRLPFFALDTRRAWSVRAHREERDYNQYFRTEVVSAVNSKSEDFLVEYGFSNGLSEGVSRRFTVGFRHREETFRPALDEPPPATLPVDQRLDYPFLQYERVEDRFSTGRNVNQIQRTEDLYLGHWLLVRAGWADTALGSNQDRLVLEAAWRDTLHHGQRSLAQHEFAFSGFYNVDESRAEEVVATWEAKYFRSQTDKRSFFAKLAVEYTLGLESHQQVVMGGYTGLRGYGNRFQNGDRSVLLTLEQRFYTDLHLLQLARVGWAAFIDVGHAWDPDIDSGSGDRVLANIGIGLRLASSRSEVGRMMHIDLAVPLVLQDDPNVSRVQFVVDVKREF